MERGKRVPKEREVERRREVLWVVGCVKCQDHNWTDVKVDAP